MHACTYGYGHVCMHGYALKMVGLMHCMYGDLCLNIPYAYLCQDVCMDGVGTSYMYAWISSMHLYAGYMCACGMLVYDLITQQAASNPVVLAQTWLYLCTVYVEIYAQIYLCMHAWTSLYGDICMHRV